MIDDKGLFDSGGVFPSRRRLLQSATAAVAAFGAVSDAAAAPSAGGAATAPGRSGATRADGSLQDKRLIGFVLAHEQFPVPDPAKIQRLAEQQIPLQQIIEEWPVGTDPAVHVAAIDKLFASGATIVNIHSGQADQKKVIDFYARSVLPRLGNRS
jgi:hypothetical protein